MSKDIIHFIYQKRNPSNILIHVSDCSSQIKDGKVYLTFFLVETQGEWIEYELDLIQKVLRDDLGFFDGFRYIHKVSSLICPKCMMEYDDGQYCRLDGTELKKELVFEYGDRKVPESILDGIESGQTKERMNETLYRLYDGYYEI